MESSPLPRNIDFAALRFLRRKYGVACPAGTVVVRQGQTGREFFVILSGRIELSLELADPSAKGVAETRKQVLTTLGPGDFFGEMGTFTGQPRSATATAMEDASLLYFDNTSAVELLKTSPQFALGMIQTLCDRLRATDNQIAQIRREFASTGTPETVVEPPPTTTDARPEPKPLDDAIFWVKEVTCPVCRTPFSAPNVRDKAIHLIERESDFHEIHQGVNPLYYGICVCPTCFYAAYSKDFPSIGPAEIQQLRQVLDERKQANAQYTFTGERDAVLASQSYRLALLCDSVGRGSPSLRQGRLYQALSWIAREEKQATLEKEALTQALACYRAAYEKEMPPVESEGTLAYLIGELSLRLDQMADARQWLRAASTSEEARRKPTLARMIRERMSLVRATDTPTPAQ